MADVNFYQLKKYDQAAKHYEILSQFKPHLNKHDYYKFQMAKSLMENKNYPRAITLFNEIASDPKNKYQYEAYFQKGLINFYNKKWETAIEHFKVFIANSPSKDYVVQAKFLIANCYETQEKLREAALFGAEVIRVSGNYDQTKLIASQFAQRTHERRVGRNHAALALHRFEHDGDGIRPDQRFNARQIVVSRLRETRHLRRVERVPASLPGHVITLHGAKAGK